MKLDFELLLRSNQAMKFKFIKAKKILNLILPSIISESLAIIQGMKKKSFNSYYLYSTYVYVYYKYSSKYLTIVLHIF